MNNVDVALMILRLTVGLTMAAHGAQKLFGAFGGHGLRGTGGALASQGFRPASLWAFLGGTSEFGGGLLFALGLFSPLGAIGIAAAMLTAVTKLHWPKFWAANGGFEYALVMLAVALAVGIAGPGALALDGAWGTSLPAGLALAVALLAGIGYLAGMITSAVRPKEVGSPKALPQ